MLYSINRYIIKKKRDSELYLNYIKSHRLLITFYYNKLRAFMRKKRLPVNK